MKEIVLKREASVTSAEALDQINSAYPNAEILSFRRIKEAGNSSEFFITRVRFAALNEDAEDLDTEESENEKTEDEKLSEIMRLIKELVDDEDADAEEHNEYAEMLDDTEMPDDPQTLEELEQDHEAKPLPELQDPAFGVGGTAQNISPIASLIVERKADVPKSLARLELIREFSPEYKVGKINKQAGVFRAYLHKRSEDYNDPQEDRRNVDNDPQEYHREHTEEELQYLEEVHQAQLEREAQRNNESRISEDMLFSEDNMDELGLSAKPPPRFQDELHNLSPVGRAWLHFLDEVGAPHKQIINMKKFLEQLSPREQGKWVKTQFDRNDNDPSTDFGVGPEGTGPKGNPGKAFEGEMDPSFVKGDKTPKKHRVILPNYIRKNRQLWEEKYGRGAGKVADFKVHNDIRKIVNDKQKAIGGKDNFVKKYGPIDEFYQQLSRVEPEKQEAWLQRKFAPEDQKQKSEDKRQSIGDVDLRENTLSQTFKALGDVMTPGDAASLFDQHKKLQQRKRTEKRPASESPEEQVIAMDPDKQKEIEKKALKKQQAAYKAYMSGDTQKANLLYGQAALIRSRLDRAETMPKGRPAR